jgi:DNA gyrase subunit A
VKEKVFEEIYDIRDESSKEGIRIIIEVKKDRDIDNLLNGLYKKTQMEDTYGVNLLAIRDKKPQVFHLKSMLEEFIAFQEELYTKEFRNLLEKAKNRHEIVEGLIKATDVIDLIIEILRGSTSPEQAKGCLVEGITDGIRFKNAGSEKSARKLLFTEAQANAIFSMPLDRLIGLEIKKLHTEYETLVSDMKEYEKILSDKKELYKVIKSRLREYKKKFGKERKTALADVSAENYVKEVKIEDIVILIDRFGYVKSVDQTSFGRVSEEAKSEYPYVIRMKNTDKLCLFTAEGDMHQVKSGQIPKCKIKDKGILIHSLCKVDNEEILLYTSFESLFESMLFFATEKGYVKMVSGAEFETNRSQIAATKLEDEDSLVSVKLISAGEILSGDKKVILLTKRGLSLGFSLSEVSELKKTSRGVKGIALERDDTLVYGGLVDPRQETFEANGQTFHAKRVRNRKRAAKGQKANLK